MRLPLCNLGLAGLLFPLLLAAQKDYVSYSTYFGGNSRDLVHAMVTDLGGNVYLTGETYSPDFPVTPGAAQSAHGGVPGTVLNPPALPDAFVVKLNPLGAAVFATYLGGPGAESGLGIAVDAGGNVYAAGTVAGAGIFVSKLSPDGKTLIYSAKVGEASTVTYGGIAVNATGNAYVTGTSNATDLPATAGAYSNSGGAFVAELNPGGSGLAMVTYLEQPKGAGRGIAVDGNGSIYVAGSPFAMKLDAAGARVIYSTAAEAESMALDAKGNVYLGGNINGGHAQVAMLNPAGAQVYSSALGGSGTDRLRGLTVDPAGNVYVSGTTTSTDFPVTASALPKRFTGGPCLVTIGPSPVASPYSVTACSDAFVARFDTSGRLVDATYLSGSDADSAEGIALSPAGSVWVGGSTGSNDFWIAGNPFADHRAAGTCAQGGTSAAVRMNFACEDAFATKLDFGTPLPPGLSLVNGASFLDLPAAPGEIVSLFGNDLGPVPAASLQIDPLVGRITTSLVGTQVLFDGVPAPLLTVGNQQINAIVPNGVSGRPLVVAMRDGVPKGSVTLTLGAASPGILAAVNVGGGIFTLYAIGLGRTDDLDGTIAKAAANSLMPPVVVVGTQLGTVLYAGPSPGLTSAVTQINVRLPAGVSGPNVPFYVAALGFTSTAFTVAIP